MYVYCIYMCEYSDAIKLPKSDPPSEVSRGYILTNFWLTEEVNKEVKKKLYHQCL